MRKFNTLVLFTQNFPYFPGEQFLESEILYLATSFDSIIIVPANSNGSPRPIPHNATVNLASSRFSFRILFRSQIVSEIGKNIIHLLHPRGFKRFLQFIYQAEKIRAWVSNSDLKTESTLLYSYWLDASAVGLAFSKYDDNKRKFISRGHGWDIYKDRHNPPYLPFRTFLFSQTDAIYAISNHGKKYIETVERLNSDTVFLARLGVKPAKKISLPSKDGVFRLVSCSSVITVKRLDRIVSALLALSTLAPKTTVIWTHFGTGVLIDKIKEMTKLLPEHISVNFVGHVDNQEVLRFYCENPVDLFVNTSISEGIPVSIMEAQAHGIPIIAPAIGGIPEIISNSNGTLLEHDFSSEDLANSMVEFIPTLFNSTRILKVRENALHSWSTNYDATYNYKEFCNYIANIKESD